MRKTRHRNGDAGLIELRVDDKDVSYRLIKGAPITIIDRGNPLELK